MVNDGGVNDTGDRTGSASGFMERFGEVAALDKIGETLEEFADVDGGAVEVKETFSEDGDGDDAAGENGPHEQATLLDVIDHVGNCLRMKGEGGKWEVFLVSAKDTEKYE